MAVSVHFICRSCEATFEKDGILRSSSVISKVPTMIHSSNTGKDVVANRHNSDIPHVAHWDDSASWVKFNSRRWKLACIQLHLTLTVLVLPSPLRTSGHSHRRRGYRPPKGASYELSGVSDDRYVSRQHSHAMVGERWTLCATLTITSLPACTA
jgi:hypothetical protein